MSLDAADVTASLSSPLAPSRASSPAGEIATASAGAGHLVQFYVDDDHLAASVAAFVAEGFAAGEPVTVIATAAHRALFQARLQALGHDVVRACAEARLAFVDADELMARLVRDGHPDEAVFDAAVTQLVDPAGPRRRFFGEVVDLLWRRGDRTTALELEDLWNDLHARCDVTVLCAYALGELGQEPSALQRVCNVHSHVVDGETPAVESPAPPQHTRRLAREVAQRARTEQALRASVREVWHKEDELRRSAVHLRTITDALPGLVSYIGADRRYQFVSATYERWFGRPRAQIVGATVEEIVGAAAYRAVEPYLTRALAGEEQRFESDLPYREGGARAVEAHYLPQRDAGGRVVGCVALVVDIGERRAFERFRAAATSRAERLLHITAAIADAVGADEVYAAVVDQVADALGASNVALWLVDGDGDTVRLMRSFGYAETSRRMFAAASLAGDASFPALDAIRREAPVWISSKAELLREYPHLSVASSAGGYRIACLPVTSRGRTIGSLGIGIADEREIADDDRDFLQLVARYASQAIERVRLLAENQAARARAEQLYRFADAVVAASRVEEVFDVALAVIEEALGTPRAAILLFDGEGVMRFRAARGLSDEYRAAVEGHCPWPRDVVAPRPVVVEDAAADESLAGYRALFAREGIGALAFIPLATRGKLIGKFMVYHREPHAFSTVELELATAIGNHLASVIARFAAIGELEETIRYNELFAGVLAHDLRNPLGAMMTAAQIMLLRQDENDRHLKPVGRIVSSGQRMTRMIDQLLDFTRARVGGGIEVRPRTANLAELCGQAIAELELANPEWKIEHGVLGDLDGEWDPDRLLQIISNLIGNAVQHGDPDAGILVLLDGRAPAQVTMRVHNKGSIPPALLPGLFDPFRATRHRRDHSRGLGLGLFIVKELLRAHGGSVEVVSTEQAGTTFTIALPRRAPAARASGAPT